MGLRLLLVRLLVLRLLMVRLLVVRLLVVRSLVLWLLVLVGSLVLRMLFWLVWPLTALVMVLWWNPDYSIRANDRYNRPVIFLVLISRFSSEDAPRSV